MAKLCIYNEITDEETKVMYTDWFGTGAVCYKDINDFVDNIGEDDNEIDIRLHCPGGNCIEGWAIYDRLRQSGKEISATVEGECASMATIILLAAPKERRFGFENSRICIHNPAVEWLDICSEDRLTADELKNLKAKLTATEIALIEEQNKILALYVERTGCDRETLQTLMNEDKFIDMSKAIELGFIASTIAPNTAKKTNKTSMKQEKITIENRLMKKILAMAGIAKIEDVAVLDQKITSADGSEFTVEREDGDPQVGDKAYPDGNYTLEDGTVIVIEEETIVSITPASEAPTEPEAPAEPEESEEDKRKKCEEQIETLTSEIDTLKNEIAALQTENESLKSANDVEGLQKQIDELAAEKESLEQEKKALEEEKASLEAAKAEVDEAKVALEAEKDELQEKVNDLEESNADLTAKVEGLTKAQKNEEEIAILDIVASAGGKAWLDAVCQMKSTFNASNRSFVPHGQKIPEGETSTQRALREKQEAFAAKREAKTKK